jgi:hypothetical protein
MPVSSNSIIHYTKKFEILLKILEEGFKVTYCVEAVRSAVLKFKVKMAVPMISFCDIPFSDFEAHINSYGSFGIGLSKKWATKNGLNPVLYLEENSTISQLLTSIVKDYKGGKAVSKELKDFTKNIAVYTKNYEGLLSRDPIVIPNYRYYDEREWRYIPSIDELKTTTVSIRTEEYKADKKKFNDSIDHLRIKFEPEDITYIVVEKLEQIEETINFLRQKYHNKYTGLQLDILLSKIISCEQIKHDF